MSIHPILPSQTSAVRARHDQLCPAPAHKSSHIIESTCSLGARFPLRYGGELRHAEVKARIEGPEGAPVIAVLGGISANRFVHEGPQGEGWWAEQVGPKRAIDTGLYRVLSFDFITPDQGQDGLVVSTHDQARALSAVLDHLAIERLRALVGASYGGMTALAFAALEQDRVERLLILSAAHRTHPMTTALRSVQRQIVRLGLKGAHGAEAVALARQLAMTTYRTWDEFDDRFSARAEIGADGPHFAVEDYLQSRGRDYAAKVSPQRFLGLSHSLDMHQVDVGHVRVPASFFAVRQDGLVPVSDMRALKASYGGPSSLLEVDSLYGHDAFLKEVGLVSSLLRRSLGSPEGECLS